MLYKCENCDFQANVQYTPNPTLDGDFTQMARDIEIATLTNARKKPRRDGKICESPRFVPVATPQVPNSRFAIGFCSQAPDLSFLKTPTNR